MAALYWLVQGYGYDISAGDVLEAYAKTLEAAENAVCADEVRRRVRLLVATETSAQFVSQVLECRLAP